MAAGPTSLALAFWLLGPVLLCVSGLLGSWVKDWHLGPYHQMCRPCLGCSLPPTRKVASPTGLVSCPAGLSLHLGFRHEPIPLNWEWSHIPNLILTLSLTLSKSVLPLGVGFFIPLHPAVFLVGGHGVSAHNRMAACKGSEASFQGPAGQPWLAGVRAASSLGQKEGPGSGRRGGRWELLNPWMKGASRMEGGEREF